MSPENGGKPEKKEMSDQMRAVVAAALSLLVIIGFEYFNKSQQPPPPTRPPISAPLTSGNGGGAEAGSASGASASSAAPLRAAKVGAGAPAAAANAISASTEQAVVIESPLYRVQISNRGATVRSWQLRQYNDGSTPPRVLDIVNAPVAQALDGWPLSIDLQDSDQESGANSGLYQVSGPASSASGTLQAPADLTFTWSDGHLRVTKHFQFDATYIANIETSVTLDGRPIPFGLAWRGGFGDPTLVQRRGVTPPQVFSSADGKIDTTAAARLGQPKNTPARITLSGPYDFVGIEDLYFAAAFLQPLAPSASAAAGAGQIMVPTLTLTDWAPVRNVIASDGKATQVPIPEMAVGSDRSGPLALRLYVGPKSIDSLRAVRPPLNGLVQFGWFAIIAEPFFYVLRWIHNNVVHNYGWAIVIFAIAINVVLFPLKAMSMRAAQKMQRAAPEIKAINEKYKKYGMRDPRRQEAQKEIMAVYSREGINPLGSCWPQLVQFPLWYAVYRMLEYTIELRQAPWFGWIHDLSGPDPYYVLPILLAVIGYAQMKMMPQPGVDPAQARMMSFMPLFFGFLFIFYPSGLSLYILIGYVVGIAQQYYLNRTSPLKPPKPVRALKKARA